MINMTQTHTPPSEAAALGVLSRAEGFPLGFILLEAVSRMWDTSQAMILLLLNWAV